MYHVKHLITILIPLLVAAGVAAYGSVSRHAARDGGNVYELVWPSPDQVEPLYKGGAYPELSSLRQIHAGMNMHQIASLIGYPHFHGDAWSMHEWNYVFHLPTVDGGSELCQYKVLFDGNGRARSFYWKSASCADLLKTRPVAYLMLSRNVSPGSGRSGFRSRDQGLPRDTEEAV